MTALWTAAEAAEATGGRATRDWTATGVSIDTRSIRPGDLFIALRDVRDGHDFVADALAKSAAAALVSRVPDDVPADAPLLVVGDVMEGLRALGRAGRARFRGRVVAVTGSAGKTGTKEMLRCALGAQGRVCAAEKSFNNHWGVPLTLARLEPRADFAVIEIGMNAPGEIEPLARMARPDVALVTTVAPVHLAAFGRIEGIAREKAAIFRGLVPGGTAIINRDVPTYPILLRAARAAGAVPVRFGTMGRPEYRLIEAHVAERATAVRARARRREIMFRLAAPGRHLALNALAVLAAVEALGGDLARAALALASWEAPEGRGALIGISMGPEGRDGALALIDESYNANPASVAAALEVLAATAPSEVVAADVPPVASMARGGGRRLVFLGDMLELGQDSEAMHAALAAAPGMASVDAVHCAGPLMAALHRALPPARRGVWFETSEGLAARAPHLVRPGDVVMVKGSLGARMGRVVDAIKRLGARQTAPAGE